MPISKSGGAVKVDKSACIPFGNTYGSIALTTAYQTLQSITGKGYLDTVIFMGHSNVHSLRITIDGVVKFEGSGNASTGVVGVTKRDLLLTIATSTTASTLAVIAPNSPNSTLQLGVTPSFFVGFPYTANVTQGTTLSMITDSIYFSSSLLIEVKSGVAHGDSYYLSGGYQ